MKKLLQKHIQKSDKKVLSHTGDVYYLRNLYKNNSIPRNLNYLLSLRYSWMKNFLEGETLELGSGSGVSKYYLAQKKVFLSDLNSNSFLDFTNIDSMDLPFEDERWDAIICNNVIHHVSHPMLAFKECWRTLKPGGVLIIQDIYASVVMRTILKITNHESYDLNVDPLDVSKPCNDPQDAWSANCAISKLIFDEQKVGDSVLKFKIIYKIFDEFLIFLNSGGVVARIFFYLYPK